LLRLISFYASSLWANGFWYEDYLSFCLAKWAAAMPKVYEGVYHFGESEVESDFVLVVSEGTVSAQIRSGEWQTKLERWRKVFQNLTNVRIINNKFYSKEIEDDFVTFISEGKKNYGLRIGKPWSSSVEKG
jgi:hypothetical protein